MQASVTKLAITAAHLEPWPIPQPQVRSGHPEANGAVLWKSQDSVLANGVWECSPGTFAWTYTWDETSCVAAGRATLRSAEGSVLEIGPGDICSIPRGAELVWEVHEPVRKGFCLFSPAGLPL